MKITKQEYAQEKHYLEETRHFIEHYMEENQLLIEEDKENIVTEREYIWSERGHTSLFGIGMMMNELEGKINYTNERIQKGRALKKALGEPYFGRIDFREKQDLIKVYLGLTGIHDQETHYVFDWRAPISSLFYNYEVGPASYLAPIGEIEGTIELKRQYKIENGSLIHCFNSNININDEILQSVLANNSSEKMQNIVTTIQKEQNAIIRNQQDRYMIVQGVAGSGKTSVALHRIAYLLYQDKELRSNNVLILSPNSIFSEYISDVLPELGEDNVMETTFSSLAKSYLNPELVLQDYTSFIESYYQAKEHDPKEDDIITFKFSLQYQKEIDLFLQEYQDHLHFQKDIKLKNKVFKKEELQAWWDKRYPKLTPYEILLQIAEDLYYQMQYRGEKMIMMILEKLYRSLKTNLDAKDIYNEFLKSSYYQNGLKEPREEQLSDFIPYPDLTGILYIHFRLHDFPYETRMKHIIIDEVQDYSFLQLFILKQCFPKASFTLLGDIYQTMNPYYHYSSLKDMGVIFNDQARYIELLKTYRSSEEIIQYSNQILGIDHVCAIRKSIEIPVIQKVEKNLVQDIKEDIKLMRKNHLKRIAIITKTMAETNSVYDRLKGKIKNLEKLTKEKVHSDIVVLPAYLAKGLEFDGVISYHKKENPYLEKEKYLFYVVVTRAQHQLIVYHE